MNSSSTSHIGQAPARVVLAGLLLGGSMAPVLAQEPGKDALWMPGHSGQIYQLSPGNWDGNINPPHGGQSLRAFQGRSGFPASTFRLSQPVGMGLNIDTGVYQYRGTDAADSEDTAYFLGVSYSDFDGGVWYTNSDALDGRRGGIEASWTHAIDDDLSVTLRMGHREYMSNRRLLDSSSLSIGAQRRLGNVGFGLGVIDRGLIDTPQGDRFLLFGNVSAAFP